MRLRWEVTAARPTWPPSLSSQCEEVREKGMEFVLLGRAKFLRVRDQHSFWSIASEAGRPQKTPPGCVRPTTQGPGMRVHLSLGLAGSYTHRSDLGSVGMKHGVGLVREGSESSARGLQGKQ